MFGKTLGDFVANIIKLAAVSIVIAILGIIYFIFTINDDKKSIKTQTKPEITWELKANGQKVDTIWVYKFK